VKRSVERSERESTSSFRWLKVVKRVVGRWEWASGLPRAPLIGALYLSLQNTLPRHPSTLFSRPCSLPAYSLTDEVYETAETAFPLLNSNVVISTS
jgi:hypothetical protein